MVSSEENMWTCMDSCNGEIRVMAGRYGGGWLAAGCAKIEWEFDDQWQNLVFGDNDCFSARDFFKNHENLVLIEHASSARNAFDACVAKLTEGFANDAITPTTT